jgi:DNA-binding SARP family transcriptional activator
MICRKPMRTYEIRLMGAFQVWVDDRVVETWPHRRAAELVKLLALADRRRLHREQVMDALWPELEPDAAAANLRKAVHFARRALGAEEAIGTAAEWIELAPAANVSVDVEIFEQAARAALGSNDEVASAQASELWPGDLLAEDRYASWAEERREGVRLLALQVLKAASLWERVLEIDPVDEEAHRALMQEALDAGDRRGAIRQFERLRERLRTDLGMGPDKGSVALYEKALAMEGGEPPTQAEQIRALLAWGLVHLNTGDFDEAERTAEEARALAVDGGLGREIGEASALLGILANMQGRWKEVFRAEFVASVRRSPDIAAFVFDAHLCLAEFCLCGPTPYEEIVAYAGELLEVAEEAGSVQGRALARLLLGEADLFSDRVGAAEEQLTAAMRLHEEARATTGQAVALQRLAEAALARGQRWRARRMLQRGLRLSETSPLAPHLVVRMHGGMVESAADIATAVEQVESADDALAGKSVCPPCSMGFRIAASVALARAGRIDQARRRLDESERLAGMWPGDRGTPPSGRRGACCAGQKATKTRPRPFSGRRPNASGRRGGRATQLAAEPRQPTSLCLPPAHLIPKAPLPAATPTAREPHGQGFERALGRVAPRLRGPESP